MKRILAADLFCGAGGASHGLVRACRELGLELDLIAINHWPIAVETHQLNHPNVRHLCEAVDKVDPLAVVPGGRLHLLLAGPECTHFSTARGGRPVNPQSRASAWSILKWAQELYIDTILIENVPEFRTWGPVGANGKPLKSKRGETYRAFLEALRSLGYRVEDKILCAADYGDPTTRKRLFIVAHRGARRVTWPEPSHSQTGGPSLFGETQRWKPARDIIDWSLQGKSIFNRKKPLKPNTIARILAGLEKFGGPDLKPFIVVLRNHAAGKSLDDPLPALCTSNHVGVAEPFLLTTTHGGRVNDMAAPMPTVTGARRGEIGVVEPFVISAGGANLRSPRGVDSPLPTVMGSDRLAIVEPMVLGQHGGATARPVSQPLPTIATDGAISVIEPFIVDAAHGSGQGSGSADSRTRSVDEPVGTLPGSNRFAVAEPFLVPFYGEREGQTPRTHSVDEPVPVIPASGDGKFAVIEPFIVTAGGPVGQGRNANSLDEPLQTVLAENHRALIEPFILQQQSNGAPRSTDEPLPTIATAGKQAIVEPFLTKFYRTATGAQSVDEPLDTITTKDRIGIAEPFVVGMEHGGRVFDTDAPLPTITTAKGGAFALVQPVINGFALDIRFRMLQPHELAAATSFPKGYQFRGTREEVVKQIGNAWPGLLGKALCLEQIGPYATRGKKSPAWKTERTA